MTYIKKDRPEGGASERPGPQTYEKAENNRKSIVAQFPPFRKPIFRAGKGALRRDVGTVFHDCRDRLLHQRPVPGDRSDRGEMMGMVSQDRRMLLDYLWDREDPDDPESMEWRDDLDAEELALVESWDRIYAQATLKICQDMLALEEGR